MTDILVRKIPEYTVEGKRLGRHVVHDPRSKDFPAETASVIRSVKHSVVGLPLDQGPIGSCTADALCGALDSAPLYNQHTYDQGDAYQLYEAETALEGEPWVLNKPTVNDIGGSGLYVCRAAKHLGWVRYYRHAFGLDHALRALVLRPVIFGVDWYESFDAPDPATGVVTIKGRIRGGHEIVADEIDAEGKMIGFWNSWGPEYGLGGRFYMPWEVVDRLLQDYGDATVPYV